MNQYCDTYIKISKDAFIHNAKYFKKKSHKKLIAVIKSNAYGHGLILSAHILENEADIFAVASLDSAIKLREAGIRIPILVLNPLDRNHVKQAIENNIMMTVSQLDEVKEIEQQLDSQEEKIKVHIKIDTGMNRMGLKTKEEYREVLEYINQSKHIQAVGVYTHYHSPEDNTYSKLQQEKFIEIYQSFPYDFKYVHLCSTYATLNHWDIDESTHVRVGLGLYGICESDEVKPVLSMYSRIKIKKTVVPNETVGYSAKYKVKDHMYIGVLPCGYSDGIIRSNSGRKVYIGEEETNIIGNVCMNSLMIQLPRKEVDDEVELIGPHIKALEIADYLKTISYEVTTNLPPHIKRIVE